MEIRNLRTFAAIARFHSFSRAAVELGYTQANVTMQIKALESELELRLFDRMGKQIHLTESGEKLLPYAQQILKAEEEAQSVLSHKLQPRGALRLGVYDAVGIAFLPHILSAYHQACPQVHIDIKTGSLDLLSDLLNNNALDLIWIFDNDMGRPGWKKQMRFPHRFVVICGPDNPLSTREITRRELEPYEFILGEKSCGYRALLEAEMGRTGGQVKGLMEIDNPSIIAQMVACGLGLAFLPQFLVQEYLDTGRVQAITVQNFEQVMCSQIFTHQAKTTTAAMEAFIEVVRSDERIRQFTVFEHSGSQREREKSSPR